MGARAPGGAVHRSNALQRRSVRTDGPSCDVRPSYGGAAADRGHRSPDRSQLEGHVHARFAKWGTALALSVVMVVGTAGVAGASAEAKGNKSKFCKQAGKVGTDITQDSSVNLSEDEAADLEKQFNKLSKLAPTKKVQQATKEMASYFGELADGTDPDDISASDYEDFGIASGRFGLYLTTQCITELVPDITIPDITLPDINP